MVQIIGKQDNRKAAAGVSAGGRYGKREIMPKDDKTMLTDGKTHLRQKPVAIFAMSCIAGALLYGVTVHAARAMVADGTSAVPASKQGTSADRRLLTAQAGSSGGSVVPPGSLGVKSKSISGGGEPAKTVAPKVERKSEKRPKERRKRSTASSADRGCRHIAGTWTAPGWWNGIYGRSDVTFNSDGTARHRSGIVGTWSCKNREFEIHWKDWANGSGTVSDDGATISDRNGKLLFTRRN